MGFPNLNFETLVSTSGLPSLLMFRNLDLETPCSRLALVFYLIINFTKVSFYTTNSRAHLDYTSIHYHLFNAILHIYTPPPMPESELTTLFGVPQLLWAGTEKRKDGKTECMH